MAPSNHSRQSARKTSPGLMLTAAGMSGCHLLCPTNFWSVNFLVLSRGNRFFGIYQDLSFVRCLGCLQFEKSDTGRKNTSLKFRAAPCVSIWRSPGLRLYFLCAEFSRKANAQLCQGMSAKVIVNR